MRESLGERLKEEKEEVLRTRCRSNNLLEYFEESIWRIIENSAEKVRRTTFVVLLEVNHHMPKKRLRDGEEAFVTVINPTTNTWSSLAVKTSGGLSKVGVKTKKYGRG